jgi:hypothetical protein
MRLRGVEVSKRHIHYGIDVTVRIFGMARNVESMLLLVDSVLVRMKQGIEVEKRRIAHV